MDEETVRVYEERALEWRGDRAPRRVDDAAELGARAQRFAPEGTIVDLGCGPGWFTPALGERVVALDAAMAMLALVPDYAPNAWRVQADLAHLPFRQGSCAGVWAAKSYIHLPRQEVPRALAEMHQALAVGAPADFLVFAGDSDFAPLEVDDFAGRRFSEWDPAMFTRIVAGAGFAVDDQSVDEGRRANPQLRVQATRAHTLPDWVGPDMRLLVVGLNPSGYSADVGIGYGRPGNRFWPAALRSGLVHHDRDPRRALDLDGVGMTDLVKRPTARADELDADEYRTGLARVEHLVAWLQPKAVCIVGLAGWRVARDRKATAGVQPENLAGRPVYVMPSTSGLNAHSSLDDLTDHLQAAARLADH